jgi:hypothetical protein
VPGDVVQRRVPGAGRTGDRSPRASALLLVRRAPVARAAPVRDPGTRASLAGTGRTCCSPRGRIRSTGRRRRTRLRLPGGSARCTGQSAVGRGENRRASKSIGDRGTGGAGRASPHTSAPPWRVRALHRAVGGGSRREPSCVEVDRRPGHRWCRPASPHTSAPPWRVRALHRAVGGGSRREPSCVEVGRRPECTVGGEPEAADVGRQGSDGLGDRVVGRGHPGKRATGLGMLGALRRTTSSGWLPWSRLQRADASIRSSRERAP